jgi:CRP-like cAMP-binding protein
MKYDYVSKGKDVFEAGTEGNAMFIILKGKIRVLIRAQIAESLQLDDVTKLDNGMIEVKQQGEGTLFGELALINKKSRAATINCVDDTHLAVINKKDFNTILKSHQENRLNELISFFKEIPLFSQWGKVGLTKLQLNFEEVAVKKGDTVFEIGQQAKYIYVVISGEFEVRILNSNMRCTQRK